MLDNMRVVVVTPAGRKRYLEILFKYIEKLRPVIDEYRLWVNTEDADDIKFMEDYQKEHSEFVTLEYLPKGMKCDGCFTIRTFFKNCVDPNTLYVRFDDDIVYIDNIEKFTNFLKFRRDNPQYFLVYGNIVNNSICSHLHQRNSAFDISNGIAGYNCMDAVGWKNPQFAKNVHYNVFKNFNDLSRFRINNWLLYYYERVSINCISWRGDYFQSFGGEVDLDEEQFFACTKPARDNKFNIIYGDFLCIHYAFFPQREGVDNDTSIISRYKEQSLKTENLVQIK